MDVGSISVCISVLNLDLTRSCSVELQRFVGKFFEPASCVLNCIDMRFNSLLCFVRLCQFW